MATRSVTGMAAHTKEADVISGRWSEANNPQEPKDPVTGPVKRVRFADDITTTIPNANANDVVVASVAHATTEMSPKDNISSRLLTARFSMTAAQQREILQRNNRAPDDDGEEMCKWQTVAALTVREH